MKKVLINAEALDRQYAGIHYYMKLLRLGFETYYPDYPVYYIRDAGSQSGAHDLPVKSLLSKGRDPVKHLFYIPRLVRNFKPDVYVELTHLGPFRLPASVKRISVVHDLTPLTHPKFHPGYSSFLQKYLLKHSLHKADRIVANSNNTCKDVQAHYPGSESKMEVIYPGIEDFFKPTEDVGILKRLKIKQPFLLSLSTIEPRKNLGCLLDAFEIFKKRTGAPHQLVLVGKGGWKNKEIFNRLENHSFRKDIVLTAYLERDALPVVFSACEAFVFPSWYEGFGFPVLEALSCGAACIISNTSSLPEVGGEAAVYFNPASAADLAEKVEMVIANPGLKAGLKKKAGKQSALFSLQRFAAGFVDLFNRL